MARKPVGMHIEDIKADLRKQFGTLVAVSRHFGLNPNAVSVVLSQPGHSIPTERKIADLLGRQPYEVWPDRYHADGSPVSLRVDRTPTRSDAVDLRRNGAAA